MTSNEDPFALKNTKILRSFLLITGAWPGEIFEEKLFFSVILRRYMPLQSTFALLGEIYHMCTNELEFLTLGHMYITSLLTALTLNRALLPFFKRYGLIVKRFFLEFHLIHFKHKGEYYGEMYNTVDKMSYYFTIYLLSIMLFTVLIFNTLPLYFNYRNGWLREGFNDTLEFGVYYSYPRLQAQDHFLFVVFLDFITSLQCGVSICGIDLIISLIVFQIIGHIQILRSNLKNIQPPKKQITVSWPQLNYASTIIALYDDEENRKIHQILKESVEYHKMIVSFAEDLSDAFGPTLAFYYLFHLCSGCLFFLECSSGGAEAVARYGTMTIIIIGQLIQVSVVFEIVGYVSEKLIDSVYHVPWESMNLSNQRSVCIMLQRVQVIIQITAAGMVSVGVQTMAGILKTSLSYFAFLRTFSNQ